VTRGAAAALAVLLAALTSAHADGRPDAAHPAAADRVVAIAADHADVRRSWLVGPSGQAYQADGARWLRRQAGGVAADVAGAYLVGGELVVVGRAAPLYRRTADGWFALRLGEQGRAVAGRGPTPALALGRHVFVQGRQGSWSRVGAVPGVIRAVWAGSATDVWVATDAGVHRLRGKAFVKAGAAVDAIAGGVPWGMSAAGLRHLPSGRVVPARLGDAEVTLRAAAGSPGREELWVVAEAAGRPVLARASGRTLTRVDDVPGTAPVAGLAVDRAGGILIALADGTVLVRDGSGWTTGRVEDALPAPQRGPGPARTR
jgi:hypothetical protein